MTDRHASPICLTHHILLAINSQYSLFNALSYTGDPGPGPIKQLNKPKWPIVITTFRTFNFRLPFSLESGHCPFTTAAKYHVAPGSMHLPHIDQSSCFTYLCFLILHSTFALRLQQPKCNLKAAQSGLMDLTIMISDQANFLHYHPQRPKCGFS